MRVEKSTHNVLKIILPMFVLLTAITILLTSLGVYDANAMSREKTVSATTAVTTRQAETETTEAQTTIESTTVSTTKETTTATTTQPKATITTTKRHTTTESTRSVDFDGSISASDIPSFSEWDEVGYVTCSSACLNHVAITYGWAQNICDASQIVMADYRDEVFGQGGNVILCGHNYKALKNLKNARVGDSIIIETTYGANFEYRITRSCQGCLSQPDDKFLGIKRPGSSDYYMEAFDSGDTIGIFTCYSGTGGADRWLVQAKLVQGTTIE